MAREKMAQAVSRRALLRTALSASALLSSALGRVAPANAAKYSAADGELEQRLLELPQAQGSPHKARLLLPKRITGELPLLILCHGLGESNDVALGLRAWTELYGLLTAVERLAHPPVERLFPKLNYLPEQRLLELNRALAEQPLSPCAMVCPFTPNPYVRGGDSMDRIERFADYVESSLIPAVRKEAPIAKTAAGVGLAGVSMGGYVALELAVRRPTSFGRVSSVQGAFGAPALGRYTEGLLNAQRTGALRDLLLLTSRDDPFRAAHERLARALSNSTLRHELIVRPGPHNQPWLREVGCLELLCWNDRALRSAAPSPT
ncbi:MAG TPA: alpha/beta hydrolase-fold protein [Polyangiaceae bacterium]|nr:alpha/beta hydrolase-fold protein [Polyangiaceae bacterium]